MTSISRVLVCMAHFSHAVAWLKCDWKWHTTRGRWKKINVQVDKNCNAKNKTNSANIKVTSWATSAFQFRPNILLEGNELKWNGTERNEMKTWNSHEVKTSAHIMFWLKKISNQISNFIKLELISIGFRFICPIALVVDWKFLNQLE